uniref:Uncharacterized protein n=1 Tax=Parascaris equorum TaxID=6256 RepID=A0A914RFE2_PAREQ
MPSTSSKQTGSALLAPVIINGKEGTHTIKGKTVGSSGQQMDSNSEGLSMGMSLPAVMPEHYNNAVDLSYTQIFANLKNTT